MSRFDSDFTRRLLDRARGTFGSMDAVRCFVAPGRVNLIGEHTDYNDGFVLPAALDLALVALLAPREDNKAIVVSIDKGPDDEFALDNIPRLPNHEWTNYVRGVVLALQAKGGQIGGFTMVVGSTIPVGSGLSSSAALEVATGFGLGKLFGPELSGPELATMCQRVENEFVGVNCGIMDQFIVANGQADHALFLDCRDLTTEHVPIPSDLAIVICDTRHPHALTDGPYNERRASCEEAVEAIAADQPAVTALRDADMDLLNQARGRMSEPVYKRARHVITENRRVLDSVRALKQGDAVTFGRLMNESHDSLKDDYKVSCDQLDQMVNVCRGVDGVLGSRLTGAGFGGCTVTLARADAVERLSEAVLTQYPVQPKGPALVYRSRAMAGVREEDPKAILGDL